jgi:hypothetical protein
LLWKLLDIPTGQEVYTLGRFLLGRELTLELTTAP